MDYYNGVVNSDANNVDAISAVLTNSPIPDRRLTSRRADLQSNGSARLRFDCGLRAFA